MKKIKISSLKILLIIIVLIVMFLNFSYPQFYKEEVERYSSIFNVDKYLIFAIVKTESNFDKNATSEKNAKGLMQILDSTGEEIFNELRVADKYRDLYIPETNIMAGTYYISNLLKIYGSYEKAIAAYNSGMGNVNQWIEKDGEFRENILFNETQNYLNRVEKYHMVYKLLYENFSLEFLLLPDIFVNFKVYIQNIFRYIRRLRV